MKIQSEKRVVLKEKILGGEKMLICLPLTADTPEALLIQARELASRKPDLLEWRADYFLPSVNAAEHDRALNELGSTIGTIPLLYTYRIDREGACHSASQKKRETHICSALASGRIDLVDVELCNDEDFLAAVSGCARHHQVPVMLSYHNFESTPPVKWLEAKLFEARDRGANVAKIAVMPKTPQDLLNLFQATYQARQKKIGIPLVTISMGPLGLPSRIAGGLFGSDMTFAAGQDITAPGQLPIHALRSAMQTVYA